MRDIREKIKDTRYKANREARVHSLAPHHASFIFYLFTFILSLSLSACGFHPRGDVALPKAMSKTYIQGATPYSDLETALRRALNNAGAQITAAPQDASAQLRILREDFGRRVLTVAVTGKAREYELFYTVDFDVRDAGGKPLLSNQSQTLTRDFTFDETQLLGKTNEEDLLYGEMRREMVQRILRRIERAPAE